MGLIVELDSHPDDDHNHTDTLEDRLRDLLPHFYPPASLHTPKFISLLGGYDDCTSTEEWEWEQNPINFVNCPDEAVVKLRSVLERTEELQVDKAAMGALVPCLLRVSNSAKAAQRLQGLQLFSILYSNPKWTSFLQNANVHHLLKDCVVVSLSNDSVELLNSAYSTISSITGHITDANQIWDDLIEKALFNIVHSSNTTVRVEHWRGLSMTAQQMGARFVRHFKWFFNTVDMMIDTISDGVETVELLSLLQYLLDYDEIRERVDLKRSKINEYILKMSDPSKLSSFVGE